MPHLRTCLTFTLFLGIAMPLRADYLTTIAAKTFLDQFIEKLRPLDIDVQRAWWDANISGKDEDFKRKEEAQNKIDALLSNKDTFARIKELKDSGKIEDAVTRRSIDVVYLMHLEKQVDPALLKKMTTLANKLEKTFA